MHKRVLSVEKRCPPSIPKSLLAGSAECAFIDADAIDIDEKESVGDVSS